MQRSQAGAISALAVWEWAAPRARTLLALVVAFVLGTLIGFERQWRQRTAGLRTNVLVAVGAAAFAAHLSPHFYIVISMVYGLGMVDVNALSL